MQRVTQTETENEILREANRVNRADLNRVESLLEQVLAMDDLSARAYESLSQVA